MMMIVGTDGDTWSLSAGASIADQPTESSPPSNGATHSPAAVSVSAGQLRDGLQLTPHQLGEITRRLGLDVGDRPNYPRYRRAEVHLVVAVQAIRELLVPVEDACVAVTTFGELFLLGRGWIVLYPADDRWVAVAARAAEALASLLTLTGRAVVVDLSALRHRGDTAWLHLLTTVHDGALVHE